MQWKTHDERQVYTNPWANLCLVDVQQPDGRRWEHHVVRLRHLAVGAVVNDCREVLMMWRHHNYVAEERYDGMDLLVTRKGAIRAGGGEYGIIPGSMGTGSYIVKGLGNPASFNGDLVEVVAHLKQVVCVKG